MSPHRNNARLVAGACATIVVLAILVLGGFACFEWGRASQGKTQANRINELGGCRAAYRAELVDLPTFRALQAVGQHDDTALEQALRQGDVDRYQKLIDLSQADPVAFLEGCAKDGHAG